MINVLTNNENNLTIYKHKGQIIKDFNVFKNENNEYNKDVLRKIRKHYKQFLINQEFTNDNLKEIKEKASTEEGQDYLMRLYRD